MVFHPLFGARADNPLSRPSRPFAGDPGNEFVRFPQDWEAELARIPTEPEIASMSDADLTKQFDLDPDFFAKHVPAALGRWRESPSQSAIGLLARFDRSSASVGPAFDDFHSQTRAIGSLLFIGALSLANVRSLSKDRKLIRVGDAIASTLDDEGRDRFFKALLGFILWESRNRAKSRLGLIKVPKLLFRGLRDRDIQVPNGVSRSDDEPWNFRFCRSHLARRARLLETPLHAVAGTNILSFTATRTIAEYFTGDEGSVVEIGPDSFDVVSSWSLDASLANPDPVTGRQEREWIVRVRPEFVPAPEALASRDRTFAYSTRAPIGIEILHHHNHAHYELEGRRVEASFAYNGSGVGGRVIYRVDGAHWYDTRRTTKAKTGFDPMPGPGRPATGLIYFSRDPWQSKRQNIEYFEIADA